MKILIKGGQIVDGSGADSFVADILVDGQYITAISPHIQADDAQVIFAEGKTVTPGFVDFHRHCDITPLVEQDFGRIELAQGISTVTAGNCGLAPLPSNPGNRKEVYDFLSPITGAIPDELMLGSYSGYRDLLEKANPAVNIGFLAASGAIKTAVKGFANTPYTAQELAQAMAYVEEAMQAGAIGVSLGIMYQPEVYSSAKEIAQVVSPAAKYNGILTTHVRGEGDSLVQSMQEVIEIAKRAGLGLNISHFKATGIHNWSDAIFKAIECIEKARATGQEVTADFYPYDGGSSMMQSLLPPSVLGGSNTAMLARLATREGKEFFRSEVYKNHHGWDNMATSIGWDRILISSVTLPQHAAYAGRPIAEVTQELGYADAADFVADIMVEEKGRVGVIVRSMLQQDVDEVARLPWTAVISDALYGGGNSPHPRLYGAFPKFLREYAIERKIVSLPKAIEKMTSMPAARMRLEKRGLLRQGYKADIAVFDASVFTDRAIYTKPCQLATGMEYVLVNGNIAWQNEEMHRLRSGQVLHEK